MTFLAPGFLMAAAGFALAAIALHLIAWRRPDDLLLPTARFVPDQASRRAARALRPADLPLLLLRLAILGLVGAALAQPVMAPGRAGVARVVAVDRSRAVARFAEARDSALAFAEGAPLAEAVVFDSAVQVLSPSALSSLRDSTTGASGGLSAALVHLLRRAEALRPRHERVELAIVSPFAREELDAATLAVRDRWPGAVRLIHVVAAPRPPGTGSLDVRVRDDDPVAAGLRLAFAQGMVDRSRDVRVVRTTPAAADSAWARSGGVLVHWPDSSGTIATDEGPRGVLAGDRAVVAALRPMSLADSGAATAYWLDGVPAARQVSLGSGCARTVGFDAPRDGDLTLTVSFRRVAVAVLAPCEGTMDLAPLPDSVLDRLAGGGAGRAPVRTTGRAEVPDARIRAALLAAALVLGLLELLVRRVSGPRGALAGEAA
jgi:hypothetical protein